MSSLSPLSSLAISQQNVVAFSQLPCDLSKLLLLRTLGQFSSDVSFAIDKEIRGFTTAAK